jgi:hypothetical protein
MNVGEWVPINSSHGMPQWHTVMQILRSKGF